MQVIFGAHGPDRILAIGTGNRAEKQIGGNLRSLRLLLAGTEIEIVDPMSSNRLVGRPVFFVTEKVEAFVLDAAQMEKHKAIHRRSLTLHSWLHHFDPRWKVRSGDVLAGRGVQLLTGGRNGCRDPLEEFTESSALRVLQYQHRVSYAPEFIRVGVRTARYSHDVGLLPGNFVADSIGGFLPTVCRLAVSEQKANWLVVTFLFGGSFHHFATHAVQPQP